MARASVPRTWSAAWRSAAACPDATVEGCSRVASGVSCCCCRCDAPWTALVGRNSVCPGVRTSVQPGQVEPIETHYLDPRGGEVAHELLFPEIARVHLRYR